MEVKTGQGVVIGYILGHQQTSTSTVGAQSRAVNVPVAVDLLI
jgi:hypothetical protein